MVRFNKMFTNGLRLGGGKNFILNKQFSDSLGGKFYSQSLANKGKNHKNLAIDSFWVNTLGFTLIEVIAIIILLSVIALITYPVINSLISDSREDLYNRQISELERLADSWVNQNINKLKIEDGYLYNLSFEELYNQGFISEENVKNPKTGENLDGCIKVIYKATDKEFETKYDSTCTKTGEVKNPSINLTVNSGILNSQGIATDDFDVNVIGTNITSYTYCVGSTECEPTIKVNNSIGTITINNEGTNYVCVIGSSEDKNTNKLCKSYKLEKTAVVLGQLVIDGTKGLNGWYVSDVNLSVVDVAGMTSTLNINKITSDTTGTDVVLTTTASNGKTESKTYTIKVDKTKPIAGTLNINGTKGLNDWYTSDVNFTVNNGSDTTSGHNDTTSSHTSITSDTTGTNVTVTTTDNAGNSSTRTYNIKVDKTAPIAGTLTINGTKGLGDWYLSDVTLTVNNGSDATSGHASTTSSHTSITGNTNGTIVTVTTKDNAGNTSTRNYTIKINKDKPTEGTLVINGTKGLNDWYVSDVSLSVTDVEGVSSTLNINKITSDTAGTDVIVTSTNTTTGAVTTKTHTIKVDKTKPTAGTLTISGTKGENDWYLSDVTFTVNNGSDATSGHASTTSSHTSVTGNTNGTTVTVTTTDKAGNSSTRTYTIKIDKTKPTIASIKAKGYIGGNTVTGTLSDNSDVAGYYITSNSTYACSSTKPTSWSTASGTSYSLNSNTTASGTTYIWVKDKAGNTNCTSKTLYKVNPLVSGTTTCELLDGSYVAEEDNNIKMQISVKCSCGITGTCRNGKNIGTDTDRGYSGIEVNGATSVYYKIYSYSYSSDDESISYGGVSWGGNIYRYDTLSTTLPNSDLTINSSDNKILATEGWGDGVSGYLDWSSGNYLTLSKVIANGTTIYNLGFQEY